MSKMVQLENVTKMYDNGLTCALNNVNLNIDKNAFISIIGPSGSGKSTLLNMIGALDTPDSGCVKIAGQDIAHVKDLNKFRRETVGFVFQLHTLIPNLTSLENVELPLHGSGIKTKKMKEHASRLLKSLGLENIINKKPNVLSGGERQRVAVARALINQPKIILADEPTGSLDAQNSNIIMNLLQHHQKKLGATLIVVTHDVNIANKAEQRITLTDGVIT